MRRAWLGRDGFKCGVGAVAVLAIAAACDSGSETSFDGVAGQNTAGTVPSTAGSAAKAGSGAGGSATATGGMNTGGVNPYAFGISHGT